MREKETHTGDNVVNFENPRDKEILKVSREEKLVEGEGPEIRKASAFSEATLKATSQRSNSSQISKENNLQPRILDLAKLSSVKVE